MNKLPNISNSTVYKSFRIGNYNAAVVENVDSSPPIEYLHVLIVVKDGETTPCFYVTAEINRMQKEIMRVLSKDHKELADHLDEIDYESPFLCTFTKNGLHTNIEQSKEWVNINKFTEKAIEIAREHLKIKGSTIETTVRPRNPILNIKRNVSLFFGILIILIIAFPPVETSIVTGSYENRIVVKGHGGYKFIQEIGTNNNHYKTESINIPLLGIQILVLAGIYVLISSLNSRK